MLTRLGARRAGRRGVDPAAAPMPARCRQPAAGQGPRAAASSRPRSARRNVWQTSFVGQRLGPFDQLEDYHAAPCFRSQADCKAWLYWAQTDWDRYQYFNPCKKASAERRGADTNEAREQPRLASYLGREVGAAQRPPIAFSYISSA